MENAVCAVDVGTSAIRAALITKDGRILFQSRTERIAGEGTARFDPELLWRDFCATMRQLTTDLAGIRILALAVAAHVGHVFVDEDGQPVAEAGGWADERGTPASAPAWSGSAADLAILGRPAVTGGALPTLRWLRERRPDQFAQVRWVLSPKDYLIRLLTGAIATDYTSAAYTLASDVALRTWSRTVIERAGVDHRVFPPQTLASAVVGTLHAAGSAASGLPIGTLVAAGGPDGSVGVAAIIGESTDAVVDIAGTTDVLARITDVRKHGFLRSVTNPYLGAATWSFGGPTGMTGGAISYWYTTLGLGNPASAAAGLSSRLGDMKPGTDGLFANPSLTGSRFPQWATRERGQLSGLRESHTSAHIIHAVQESAAFVVLEALEAMTTPAEADLHVYVAGGAARSSHIAQLRADVWGRPIRVVADVDVTLRGAALLALVASGVYRDIPEAGKSFTVSTTEYLPRAARAEEYRRVFAEWQSLRNRSLDAL